MPYTLAQAAQATALNRTTILRSIKAGKLSATRDAGEMSSGVQFHGSNSIRTGLGAGNLPIGQRYARAAGAYTETACEHLGDR
jgi:hypothetical protein